MHGAGNDFIIIDRREGNDDEAPRLSRDRCRALANRRTGIGCDQILVLHPANGDVTESALLRYQVFNADGSSAEQCGNGIRCIAWLMHRSGEVEDEPFVITGPAGAMEMQVVQPGRVRVRLGTPEFDPARVPISLEPSDHRYRLEVDDEVLEFGAVSMGNPHMVIPVSRLDQQRVNSLGAAMTGHEIFPEGSNVGFAHVLDRQNVELQVYERGAGPTRACGSGAAAAVAVLRVWDAVDEEVAVQQPGGEIVIEWNHSGDTGSDSNKESPALYMTGPAEYVFEGRLP